MSCQYHTALYPLYVYIDSTLVHDLRRKKRRSGAFGCPTFADEHISSWVLCANAGPAPQGTGLMYIKWMAGKESFMGGESG